MSRASEAPLFSRAESITFPGAKRGVVKIERNSWVRVGGGRLLTGNIIEQRSDKVAVLRDDEVDMEYRIIVDKDGESL